MDEHDTEHVKVALVTGGNRGIGNAVAAELARRGFAVVLGSRDADRGARAAAALRTAGHRVESVKLDVTEADSIAAAAAHLADRFHRLDVLVNNAGVAGDRTAQHPGRVDLDACRDVFATNVFGAIAVTDAMLPLLRGAAAARIVNVSSGLGSMTRMSDPADYFAGLPPAVGYPSSKSALNAVTVQYAKALRAEGILVNAADPGPCATDFTAGFANLTRTAADGAAVIVALATLGPDGPTGGYANDAGAVPW